MSIFVNQPVYLHVQTLTRVTTRLLFYKQLSPHNFLCAFMTHAWRIVFNSLRRKYCNMLYNRRNGLTLFINTQFGKLRWNLFLLTISKTEKFSLQSSLYMKLYIQTQQFRTFGRNFFRLSSLLSFFPDLLSLYFVQLTKFFWSRITHGHDN